jgi:hypothetical protein
MQLTFTAWVGQAVAQLVEALHYKPEGCGLLELFIGVILPVALWP